MSKRRHRKRSKTALKRVRGTRKGRLASAKRRPTYADAFRKATRSRDGKKALSRFKRFWKLPTPPELKVMPGPEKVFVGLGISPAVNIASTPAKTEKTRIVRKRHRALLVTNSSGRRMWIVRSKRGLPKRPVLTCVGWCPRTEYLPTPAMEKARTPKARRHWVHEHTEGGGKWPKLYRDQLGNYHYGRGTYKVSDWIYK